MENKTGYQRESKHLGIWEVTSFKINKYQPDIFIIVIKYYMNNL